MACDGSTQYFTVTPGVTLTATVSSDNVSTRFRFTGGTSSTSTSTSTTQWNIYAHYEVNNTFAMNPSAPPTWDSGYSKNAVGTLAGVGSSTICSISLISGGGSAHCVNAWSDYNNAVTLPASFTATIAGGSWVASGAHAFTPTTGGNTYTANYDLSSAPHFIISIETNPVDLKNALTVQGTLYPDNPITLSVTNGSIISLKAAGTALKMPGFLTYSFSYWSQGGTQDQNYTVTGNVTLIAHYTNGGTSFCSSFSGTGANALEQQLNHGCEWSVVFYSWFGLFGPWILAFIDFLPALAIYLRTENPGAAIGVYVLIDVVLVYGMTVASLPASINTVAPGLLGAVIAGGIFQLLRSGKGG